GQLLHAEVPATGESGGERQRVFASPRRLASMFFVDRDALCQPPRYAVLRHLQRVDVRELVPQRGLPAELAGFARRGRVHHHDLAETCAQRALEAGEAHRPYGKVVVLLKDFDEDRTLRREAIAGGECLTRLLGEWNRVGAKDRGFVLRKLED